MGQQSKVSTKQPNGQAEYADQHERLDDLRCGRTAAKATIRAILNELAAKYGLPNQDVTFAMHGVDSFLTEFLYDAESAIHREMEGNESASLK